MRLEYLDWVFFWNTVDLARKLGKFSEYHNDKARRVHRSLDGTTPAQRAGAHPVRPRSLDCEFATHTTIGICSKMRSV